MRLNAFPEGTSKTESRLFPHEPRVEPFLHEKVEHAPAGVSRRVSDTSLIR